MTQQAGGLPRLPPTIVAASVGAAWGALGYALLWGHTPWSVSRAFVVSTPGALALLPVRLVLWAIHLAERWAGRAFAFADSNWWIGPAAAFLGASITAAAFLGARALARRLRG